VVDIVMLGDIQNTEEWKKNRFIGFGILQIQARRRDDCQLTRHV
jgi:hypothetical protein